MPLSRGLDNTTLRFGDGRSTNSSPDGTECGDIDALLGELQPNSDCGTTIAGVRLAVAADNFSVLERIIATPLTS